VLSGPVLKSVFDGDVPPDIGASLLNAITGVLKAIEVEDLARQIEALEGKKNEPVNA
jgi:hypothetical protein